MQKVLLCRKSGFWLVRIGSQDGFILAATLWILAAITLTAGFIALWAQHASDTAYQAQSDLGNEIALSSTRSVILYLLATQHITLAGLTIPGTESEEKEPVNPMDSSILPKGGEIRLDDRVYQGCGKILFSIQDEGGLLGLNHFFPDQLENLLGLLGIPAERRGPLIDKLLDYTDMDDLNRLNGAESGDYERAGLAPPPNRFLLSSWEARNVMGWNALSELWESHAFPRLTTVSAGGIPNPNTAPKLLLETLGGVDEEIASRIIQAREHNPFSNISDMSEAAGKELSLDPIGVGFLPSAHLRITLWYPGSRDMREIHVQLTPQADKKAPWLIDYELVVPLLQEQTYDDISTLSLSVFAPTVSSGSK